MTPCLIILRDIEIFHIGTKSKMMRWNRNNEADVTYKSPHSIRRTTASLLHTAGMPLDMVRDILG